MLSISEQVVADHSCGTWSANEASVLAEYSGEAVRPGGIRLSTTSQNQLATLLRICYRGHYRKHVTLDISEADALAFVSEGCSVGAETYGELMPEGFLHILWRIGAGPGDRFYDLGAGTGKLAAIAWLAGLHATGVELSYVRWAAAKKAMEGFEEIHSNGDLPVGGGVCNSGLPKRSVEGLDYLCDNFLNVDFTDADVLFISTVMFTSDMVAKVARIARWMKPGSKIVSYHNFADLGSAGVFPEFAIIGECIEPTSWKETTCWKVCEVVTNPSNPEERPWQLKRPHEFEDASRCTCSW